MDEYVRTILGESSLVSLWRLAEQTGTTAADARGTNAGTYAGGLTLAQSTALAEDQDSSVLLGGVSGVVTAPDSTSLRLQQPFSFEAWVKTSTGGVQAILSKGTDASTPDFEWYLNAGKVGLAIRGVVAATIGTTAVNDGAWHHLVLTYNGTTVITYLDGVANGSGSVAGQPQVTAARLTIGASDRTASTQNWVNGNLDEVAIYSSALSAAAVQNHYSAGKAAMFSTSQRIPGID